MFTQTTIVDYDVQKRLLKQLNILATIMLVIGIIGTITYIVVGTIIDKPWCDILLIFALPLGVGTVLMILRRNILKQAISLRQENTYIFEEDSFKVMTYKNGDPIGMMKVYYKDVVRCKEDDMYIYIYIKAGALPVDKRNMSSDQIVVLKSFLNMKIGKEDLLKNTKSSISDVDKTKDEVNTDDVAKTDTSSENIDEKK